jgi:hypothetical protein
MKAVKPSGRGLDAAGCDTLSRLLGGRPETVIAVHQLRRGLCSAYVVGEPSRLDAVVIQPTRLPEEPMAFGTDAGAIWSVLGGLTGWTCVNVDGEVARRLGPVMAAHLRRAVRYLGDLYHILARPAPRFGHANVRRLVREDLALLASAPIELREASLGFGTPEKLLEEGIAAGAVVGGGLVALACTTARSGRHAELGVVTAGPWRGRGLATACAALAAAGVQQSGWLPVWRADEDNIASLRVARKLGFTEVCRRAYVIPVDGGTAHE